MSTVVVSGASGMIGRAVIGELTARGDAVVALVRNAGSAGAQFGEGVRVVGWPDASTPPDADALRGADAVVNLLGEPIAQRWSAEVKRRIRDSRVLGTRSLVAAIEALSERPRVLVSQSATGYYGSREAERLTEEASPGSDFLSGVVVDWEAEAQAAATLGVRVAVTRTGVVLSSSGGALAKMLPPFKAGIGGPVAGGHQYLPWIHLADVVGAIVHALDHEQASGAFNLTAPEPVTNGAFSKALGRVLHRPAFAPVPGLALKLLYGEMAVIVLTGQRAVPAHLLEQGYAFRQPDLEPALRDVLGR